MACWGRPAPRHPTPCAAWPPVVSFLAQAPLCPLPQVRGHPVGDLAVTGTEQPSVPRGGWPGRGAGAGTVCCPTVHVCGSRASLAG